jgi:carbonic anhydrase
MKTLAHLIERNVEWSERVRAEDPDFFKRLERIQRPDYLWIGCSDSRVPANQITGLKPGEVFVHRNIANQVGHTDINCLTVVQFAVEALKVKDIIVCGHYGCGGVKAIAENADKGLLADWLRGLRDVREEYAERLKRFRGRALADRLCEINVIQQVANVCHSTIVQNAWKRRQKLTVHGWIYGLSDGLLRDLKFTTSSAREVSRLHATAVNRVLRRR